ncbi:MAG: hypothetical protein IRZ16_22055 [Myxococcaceae bacterium]|nr:hypothetical protein [Myxococcaceae bacterium]
MSAILTGVAVTVLYAAAVMGIHRWNVRRLRRRGNFAALLRLDWDALLDGLLPVADRAAIDPSVPATLPDGTPTPLILRTPVDGAHRGRRALLMSIVAGGADGDVAAFAREVGFTGGEAAWLATLALVGAQPLAALERLEASRPTSAQEIYLREHLRLTRTTTALNLETRAFATKRRIGQALARFGDTPCLYFVRALASSMVGLNRQAIDDLARAVYFSEQHSFYVRAVLDTPFIAEARPALVYQCKLAPASRSSVAPPR